MNITIISVGKIKEAFYREAVAEYEKRLGRYCHLEIVEVADEPAPDKISEAQKNIILEKEGERILKQVRDESYVISLEISGKKYDSPGFAEKLRSLGVSGRSRLVFIIGGSLGLHRSVSERADCKISFSDMTFPHQLMRVILAEQIYRAFRIMHGEPYHK